MRTVMRTFCICVLFSVFVAGPARAMADNDDRASTGPAVAATTFGSAARGVTKKKKRPVAVYAAVASYASSSVLDEARRYIGTNPTGRSSLWCGAFMDMVLKRTGHKGGGNLARGYAKYGTRINGPQVGALAVMTRGKGGGHVGVVSGIDPSGNVIVISGNTWNRGTGGKRVVSESVYPRSRVIAYVMPQS